MTKMLNNSKFDGVSCPIYALGHAYGIPLSAVLKIINAQGEKTGKEERTIYAAKKILTDKPQHAPFLATAIFYGQQILMVTPDGVLLLANEWDDNAAYRLHNWFRRAAHRLSSRWTEQIPEETVQETTMQLAQEQPETPQVKDDIDAKTLALISGYDEKYPWRKWVNLIVDLYILTSGKATSRAATLRDIEKVMTNVYGFVSTQARKEQLSAAGYETALVLPDFVELVGDDPQWRALASSLLVAMLHGDKIPVAPTQQRRKDNKTLSEFLAILKPLAEKRGDKSPHHIATLKEVCARMAQDEGVDWRRSETRYKNKYHVTEPTKTDLILDSTPRYYAFKRVVRRMLEEESSCD